jgi:hypothetical protein
MRLKLHERRLCVNIPITFESVAGRQFKLVITVGYDDSYRLREVFCADFKAGSDNQAIIMDACILLSRLLQHGDTPQELVDSMCNPPSLIGTICKAICAEQDLAIQEGASTGFVNRATITNGQPNNEPTLM